jgi:hypothetical protein
VAVAFWSEGLSDQERASLAVKAAQAIETSPEEGDRQDLNIRHTLQFESSPIGSTNLYGGAYYGGRTAVFNPADVSTWNVARSVIMTAAAMIGKNKPRARIVTTGGDYRAKHRAKKANQFCAGWAQEAGLYPLTYEALIDCMSNDLGCVQLFEEGGKVKLQRCLANEISFDNVDGMYGQQSVRTMYRRRFVSRDVLLAKTKRFAKGAEARESEIRDAIKGAESISPLGVDDTTGNICVRETWHLPSGKDTADGYHIIAIEGEKGLLFSEEWKKDYFPIVFLRYEATRSGPYAISLMAQLSPMQTEINKTLMRISKSQGLFSVPRIGLKRGSKIIKDEISNLIAGAITYTDTPPVPLVWPAMPPDTYAHLEKTIDEMYDLPGVSRNAASGVKETGTTSGAAIRESLDVQASRMETFAQAWEQFHISIFKCALDMIADIVEDGTEETVETQVRKRVRQGRGYAYRTVSRKTVKKVKGKYTVKAGKQLLEPIDWAQLGLDRDNYETQIYPVSNLPLTPQGRLDYVTDMLNAGLWDLTRAKLAMDDLDVESADDISNAVPRLIQMQMENMLYEGTPEHPDELTPYDQILQTGGMYLALGRLDKAPPKNMSLIFRYLDEAKAIQKAMAPPPAPAPMPAGPPPPPDPMAVDPMGAGAPLPGAPIQMAA